MAVNVNVRRLSQQRTRVTEVHLSPLPSPPAALLKFPGVAEWWAEMLKVRERDQQTLYQALLTKATGDEDTNVVTSDELTSCCDVVAAALATETANRTSADNALSNAISAVGAAAVAGDDTLAWMDL